MRTLIIVFIFTLVVLLSCNSTHVDNRKSNRNTIGISLDSTFINYYEKKESNYPPYIFFYYTISNRSGDTIILQLRAWDFEKEPLTKKIFSLYNADTFELFSGTFTPKKIVINPFDSIHVDFNPSAFQLMDFYEKKKDMYKSEQDFLYNFASNAVNFFDFDNKCFIDSSKNRKVIFRNPNDSSETMWK